MGDTLALKKNRESLQGRPKVCRGGRSATMMYSYPFTLCRRGVVVTMDLSARNLNLLRKDHWLSNPLNCSALYLNEPAWLSPGTPGPSRVLQLPPAIRLAALIASDMLFKQGVDGRDCLALAEADFVRELRLTPFTAKKLEKVRATLLQRG